MTVTQSLRPGRDRRARPLLVGALLCALLPYRLARRSDGGSEATHMPLLTRHGSPRISDER